MSSPETVLSFKFFWKHKELHHILKFITVTQHNLTHVSAPLTHYTEGQSANSSTLRI